MEKPGTLFDVLHEHLADLRRQRIVSADRDAVGRDLESWGEGDWVAVIGLGPDREHLAGPLPLFPEGG